MIIRKAYKVRLHPNKAQEQHLLRILGACRFIYNHYLATRSEVYKETGKNLSYSTLSRDLTKMRKEVDWVSDIQLFPLDQSLRRLNTAFNRFFSKKSKFPKFKNKKSPKQSFQKPRDWKIKGNKLMIQEDLIIKFRGKIDLKSKFGTLTVIKESDKWFASMTAKVSVSLPKRYTKPIGIDMGLTTLATLSNGKKYSNIRPQKYLQLKLRRAQQNLSRKQKGSARREKARVQVGRIYEKIRNVRQNHLHKISHDIVSKNHAMIAMEDLNVAGMMKNRKLSRAFADASVSELLRQIMYKQTWKGGQFIKVDRYLPSSKLCHACGFYNEVMPLSVRTWKCPGCKRPHDRDQNAAKNILLAAYAMRGEDGMVAKSESNQLRGNADLQK